MNEIADIDIDVADRDKAIKSLSDYKIVNASQLKSDKSNLVKHNNGIYLQNIPIDPITKLSAFTYDIAEQLQYYKLDLINFSIYELASSNKQIKQLVDNIKDLDWSMFLDDKFYQKEKLCHIGSYKKLIDQYKPSSVIELAMLISLIRPQKKHLIGKSFEEIEEVIWVNDGEEYSFKKSHAVGYAIATCVHIQLLERKVDPI